MGDAPERFVDASPRRSGPGSSLARDPLRALLAIHRAVAGRLDRAALIEAVADAVRRIVPVDRLILLLPGKDGSSLAVFGAHGRSGTRFTEAETIPAEGSIPGWVLATGRPLVVRTREEIRERFPVSYRKLVREGMESVAVLPLSTEGGRVGVLGLMASREGAFAAIPASLLEEIGTSMAAAVEGSVAYEESRRLRDELAALLEVNRTVTRHLLRDELFAALSRCLADLIPADRFGIELPVDGDRLQAHVIAPRADGSPPAQVEALPAAGTACRWTEENRRWLVAATREELRERFPVTWEVMRRENMESLCTMPLLSGRGCIGVLFFMSGEPGAYRDLRRGLLEQVAGAVAVALDNCLAYEEVRRLRDRLERENVYLQEEIRQEHHFEEIVGRSPALLEVLARVEAAAPTDSTVVILGETGTGKELIARAIHHRSRRRDRPFVRVNCSAMSPGLVESELFGHVRGAFTGAVANRVGRFELADGGTIFLDEIGDLPLETQIKLLRVLQEREIEAVGSSRTRRVDVRVVAATNRDLDRAVAAGTFRSDLFYRLNVVTLRLPPLRERPDDVPMLVRFFVERHARAMGRRVDGVSQETMRRLVAYAWPGNVRELQNVIERGLVLSRGPILELGEDLLPVSGARADRPPEAPVAEGGTEALVEVERRHIRGVLVRSGGVIEGPKGAARILGLHPNTLRSRMKKLGIGRAPHGIS